MRSKYHGQLILLKEAFNPVNTELSNIVLIEWVPLSVLFNFELCGFLLGVDRIRPEEVHDHLLLSGNFAHVDGYGSLQFFDILDLV